MDKKVFGIVAAIVLVGFSVSCCGLCVLGQVTYHRRPTGPAPRVPTPDEAFASPEACVQAFGRPTETIDTQVANLSLRNLHYDKAGVVVSFGRRGEGDPWEAGMYTDMREAMPIDRQTAFDRLYRYR